MAVKPNKKELLVDILMLALLVFAIFLLSLIF